MTTGVAVRCDASVVVAEKNAGNGLSFVAYSFRLLAHLTAAKPFIILPKSSAKQ